MISIAKQEKNWRKRPNPKQVTDIFVKVPKILWRHNLKVKYVKFFLSYPLFNPAKLTENFI